MNDQRDTVRLEHLGGSGRLLTVGVVLLLSLLLVAVFKPWGAGGDGYRLTAFSGPSVAPSNAAPDPAAPATADPRAVPCLTRDEWRIVTREQTAGREPRRWIAVKPFEGNERDRPTDSDIPVHRVVAGRLLALGYCAPEAIATLDGGPPELRLWFLPAAGSGRAAARRAMPVEGLRPVTVPGQGDAEMYVPPNRERGWRIGRYVLAIRPAGSSEPTYWLAVELVPAASG
ncbi:MAG: hypothetical protein H0X16_08130 [Chloroflexi bacterium]|nr:hypothetical protein [Chloroflexota bacterium]